MRDLVILLAHLLMTVARLLGPGSARAVVADSLLIKQQLLLINRSGVHSLLDGDTPGELNGDSVTSQADLRDFCSQTHCRGLYHLAVAA